MTGRLPDFIIIGAPKCGTTSLARWLGEHPEVFVPEAKELRFFDQNYEAGLDRYREWFATAPGDAILGEASPGYLAHPAVADRVATDLPDARYVAMVRDPVDRLWSHLAFTGRTDAITDRLPRVADVVGGTATGPLADALSHGLYAAHLDRWVAATGRGRLAVVTFDGLREDPGATFATVCSHIGASLDHAPPGVGRAHHTTQALRSPRLRRIMMRHRVWARAPRVGRVLDGWNTRGDAYAPLDDGVRRRLAHWYAPDTARLADWATVPATWSSADPD